MQVNALYVFDVEGEGKWHIDLTSGTGAVGQGEPPTKPDVTVTVNKENFLKVSWICVTERMERNDIYSFNCAVNITKYKKGLGISKLCS